MCDHNTLVRTPLIARVHQGEDGLSCHVDESGRPLYAARYQAVSAFSEGFAVAHRISGEATLIDQQGRQLVTGSHRFRWILPMSEGRAQACTNNGAPGWIDTSGVFILSGAARSGRPDRTSPGSLTSSTSAATTCPLTETSPSGSRRMRS